MSSVAEKPKIVTFDGWTPSVPTGWLVDRTLAVAEGMLELRLYKYQRSFMRRLIEAVLMREGEDLTILVSRQAGKSTGIGGAVSAMALLFPFLANTPQHADDPRFNLTDEAGNYRGFAKRFRIGIYAPKQEQAEIIYSTVSSCFGTRSSAGFMEELGIAADTWRGNCLVLSNGASIRAETASDNAKIEGSSYELLIADEAQDISDERMVKSLSPMLTSTKGTFCKIGSANTRASNFYHTIRRNRRLDAGLGKRHFHFEFDCRVAGKENSLYRERVERDIRQYGEFSDYIQMSYFCRFLLERGMFVSEKMLLDPKIALREPKLDPFADRTVGVLKRPWSVVAGIDFAKKSDTTVVTVMAVNWQTPLLQTYTETLETAVEYTAYDKHVIDWFEIQGEDYESQFELIKQYLSQFGRSLKKITLDSTGVGEALFDRYCAEYAQTDVEIEGYGFSGKSKSELYRLLHTEFCGKRFTFPYSQASRATPECIRFVTQFLELQKEYRGGLMMCEALPGPNAHDDFCDSCALAVWAAEHPTSDLQVEMSKSNFLLR